MKATETDGSLRQRLGAPRPAGPGGARGAPKLQTRTEMSDAAAGKGFRGGERSRARDRPARSRRGSRPAGRPRGGLGSQRLPPGRAQRGSCARPRTEGRVTASGGASGAGEALTWATKRRMAARSQTTVAAAAAMSAGPRRGRRQMFPSNAPARCAAPRKRRTYSAHA